MQFRNTQGKPCSWLSSFESPEESIEIDRGVVVNRRWVFGAGAAAAVGLAFPFAPSLFAQEANPLIKESTKSEVNAISLEQFLSETRPAARTMVKSKAPDEEAFIELAMQQLGRLESIEASRAHPGGKGWTMDMSAYVPPIMLYQIRMEPNSVISLHDHRFHNGVLRVREGSIRVRNFEIFEADQEKKWDVAAGLVPAMGESFVIQEKKDITLKVGQQAGLTRTRENIHQVEAGPDGCLLYDLFANFKFNAQSFHIAWDGKYSDPAKKLCQVTWIPPDHSH
jgi:hypothetical protein